MGNSNNKDRESEHTEKIRKLFDGIARKYDSINRQQSFMLDITWRRFTTKKMRFFDTMRYLDVATGTADLAIDVVNNHPGVSAVGLDIAEDLLEVGREKLSHAKLTDRIDLISGNALELPFQDNEFDVSGIAFGIRNIKDRLHALSEMTRVIKPGGQVAVLELSFHGTGIFKPFYYLYLKAVIPMMARMVAKDPSAYKYLGQSILEFPAPDDFCGIMREAGLVNVRSYPLTFGVVRLFMGDKPIK